MHTCTAAGSFCCEAKLQVDTLKTKYLHCFLLSTTALQYLCMTFCKRRIPLSQASVIRRRHMHAACYAIAYNL